MGYIEVSMIIMIMMMMFSHYYYGGPLYIGPTVHTKTYMFIYFYPQYLVLLTMVTGDQILLLKMVKYTGFYVYHKFY